METKSKSGYAKDIKPELLTADEREGKAVPVADEKGNVAGVVPLAERVYGKAKYKVVTLDESDNLTHLRTIGKIPPIRDEASGGVITDTKPKVKPTKKQTKTKASMKRTNDYDPIGGEDREPTLEEIQAEEKRLRPVKPVYQQEEQSESKEADTELEPMRELLSYLSRRQRVTLELSDGAMSLSAIDVKQSKYGVTVLMPMKDEGSIFIPKPGSEICVISGEHRWPCFFPGTYFEIEEMGVIGLVFVKAE